MLYPYVLLGLRVQYQKERAIEAFWILNDFIGDLITGTYAFDCFDLPDFKKNATAEVLRRYNKMADCFIYITLAKWIEFYDHYLPIIPHHLKKKCKSFREDLEKRGVRKFRHKVVGHIWSKEHNRPLLDGEINEMERRITQGDNEKFLRWINDPANNGSGETVVGISELVRDEIRKEWSLSQEELAR